MEVLATPKWRGRVYLILADHTLGKEWTDGEDKYWPQWITFQASELLVTRNWEPWRRKREGKIRLGMRNAIGLLPIKWRKSEGQKRRIQDFSSFLSIPLFSFFLTQWLTVCLSSCLVPAPSWDANIYLCSEVTKRMEERERKWRSCSPLLDFWSFSAFVIHFYLSDFRLSSSNRGEKERKWQKMTNGRRKRKKDVFGLPLMDK